MFLYHTCIWLVVSLFTQYRLKDYLIGSTVLVTADGMVLDSSSEPRAALKIYHRLYIRKQGCLETLV